MPFRNENLGAKLQEFGAFQAGISNVDSRNDLEHGLLLPWPSDPLASWVYYDCTVGAMLDSGIVVHNRLPQVDNTPDTLAMCDLEDPNLDNISTGGVNLKCRDQYEDIVQRMGHARYWFRLWGQALRVGYQVPIPGIKKIGGVEAIPYDKNPQWAFNRIFPGGNYAGVILWHAAWSLWYTTAEPPRSGEIPAVDAAAHTRGVNAPPADGIQSPYSRPDDNAIPTAPPLNVARPVGPVAARPNNPNL